MSLLLLLRGGGAPAPTAETAALTLAARYRIELTVHEGQQQLEVFDLAGVLIDSINLSCAAASFTGERLGLLTGLSGGGASTGNLDVENFDTSTTGAVTDTNRGTSDKVTGAGALTIVTSQFVTGAKSLRVNGTSYHQYRFDHAAHTKHYMKSFIRRAVSPGSDMYLWQVYAADGTTIGAQFGVDSTGKLFVRDSNSGTKQTAAAALTANTWFKVLVFCDGTGGLTAAYYSSGGGYTTLVETFANATTLTATSFSKENLGLVAATTGSPDIFIDSFEADSTQYPGTTTGAPIKVLVDRIKSDSAQMPAPLDVVATPAFSNMLVPTSGVLFGVTAASVNTGGHTTQAGLNATTAITGVYPHLVGRYYTGNWNGIITGATELNLYDPSTGTFAGSHAAPFIHWKVNGGNLSSLTWRDVANGAADSYIDTVANNLKSYGRKVFFTLWHEPEDDVGGTGMTAADYVAMWQHVVDRFRQRGHARGDQIIWVLQYMSFSTWAVDSAGSGFSALDPGEAYIDWYGIDPYLYNLNGRDTFDELVKENTAGVSGWGSVGIYNYLVSRHPSKPIMIAETGINIGTVATYPTLNNPGFSDANAAAVLADWQNSIADYPNIKALVPWFGVTDNGVYQPYSPDAGPLFKAAWSTLAHDAYLTQNMALAG